MPNTSPSIISRADYEQLRTRTRDLKPRRRFASSLPGGGDVEVVTLSDKRTVAVVDGRLDNLSAGAREFIATLLLPDGDTAAEAPPSAS
jgi:hypothetical protein